METRQNHQQAIEVEVPCGGKQRHGAEICVQSWQDWHLRGKVCRRGGILGYIYRILQIFAPCRRYIVRRPLELKCAVANLLLAEPLNYEEQILEALSDPDREIRQLIVRSTGKLPPHLRKSILSRALLDESIAQDALQELLQRTQDEQIEVICILLNDILQISDVIIDAIMDILLNSQVSTSVDLLLKCLQHRKTRDRAKKVLIAKTQVMPEITVERLKEKIQSEQFSSKIFIIKELLSKIPENLIDDTINLLSLLTGDREDTVRLAAYEKLFEFRGMHKGWLTMVWRGLLDKHHDVVKTVYSFLKNHKIEFVEEGIFVEANKDTQVLLALLRVSSGETEHTHELLTKVIDDVHNISKWVLDEAVEVISTSGYVALNEEAVEVISTSGYMALNEIEALLCEQLDECITEFCLRIVNEMCNQPSLCAGVASRQRLIESIKNVEEASLTLSNARLAHEILRKIGGEHHGR
jgi:hypothetical protein